MAKLPPPSPSSSSPLNAPLLPPSLGIPFDPSPPSPSPPLLVFLLPSPRHRRHRRSFLRSLLSSSSLLALLSLSLLLAFSLFLFWPSDPLLRLSRVALRSIHLSPPKHAATAPTLDVDLDLEIRVENKNLFSLDYRKIRSGIGYRGRDLGSLIAPGGFVRAKGVSYVDARLRLDGIRVLADLFLLIEDLARGIVVFDATAELMDGRLQILGFHFPIQGKVSCSINVDVVKQKIFSQDCYPELSSSSQVNV
ncbi:uncharacterized protein LOC144713059 [Wolffia australiana]